MRHALTLILTIAAAPVQAWEFTAVPVCTLTHATPDLEVRVTHDPRQADPYAIDLTRLDAPWSASDVFAMRFEGGAARTISTARHRLSTDGRTLSVRDTGFGNVLDGLEFNTTATAFTDRQASTLPLTGAAPAVRAFRACAEGGLV